MAVSAEPVFQVAKLPDRHHVRAGPVAEVFGDAVVDTLLEGQLVVARSERSVKSFCLKNLKQILNKIKLYFPIMLTCRCEKNAYSRICFFPLIAFN